MDIKNNQPAKVRKQNEAAHFQGYSLTYDNGRRSDNTPMDVYLNYVSTGQFQRFQARNFGGSTKGDWKLELKGKSLILREKFKVQLLLIS